jgi:HSP20 family protein
MDSQVKTQTGGEQGVFRELPRDLSPGGSPYPRLSAFEANGMIEMVAEVPGVPESAIEITLEGDILTIQVLKANKDEGKRAHFGERAFGRFRRSIQIPFAPEPAKVQASLKDGLLTVRFPCVEVGRTHKISVSGTQPEADVRRSAVGSSWSERPETTREPLTLDVKASPVPPQRDR